MTSPDITPRCTTLHHVTPHHSTLAPHSPNSPFCCVKTVEQLLSGWWTCSIWMCLWLHALVVIRLPALTVTLTYALIQMVKKIAGKSDKARMITEARVTELIMSGGARNQSSVFWEKHDRKPETWSDWRKASSRSGACGSTRENSPGLDTLRNDRLTHLSSFSVWWCMAVLSWWSESSG